MIGVATAAGRVLLNPPADRPIASDEQIMAISEDDDTVRLPVAAPEFTRLT